MNRRLLACSALLLPFLSLAACSSDADTSASNATVDTTADTTAAPDTTMAATTARP